MISWFFTNIGTIVVALMLLAVVGLIIGLTLRKRRINGSSGCSCGCSGCAMESQCHKKG